MHMLATITIVKQDDEVNPALRKSGSRSSPCSEPRNRTWSRAAYKRPRIQHLNSSYLTEKHNWWKVSSLLLHLLLHAKVITRCQALITNWHEIDLQIIISTRNQLVRLSYQAPLSCFWQLEPYFITKKKRPWKFLLSCHMSADTERSRDNGTAKNIWCKSTKIALTRKWHFKP